MTTARTFNDSEGDFSEWKMTDEHCQRKDCDERVEYREWDSEDGAYTDYQYRCAVGHTWWIDGIDS
jgi:hypothetical protein